MSMFVKTSAGVLLPKKNHVLACFASVLLILYSFQCTCQCYLFSTHLFQLQMPEVKYRYLADGH